MHKAGVLLTDGSEKDKKVDVFFYCCVTYCYLGRTATLRP